MTIQSLIDAGIINADTLELLALQVHNVANSKFGKITLTIKDGQLTHISTTYDFTTRRGSGGSAESTSRSDRKR